MEIEAITQLGGTVFTTALFVWYLRDKNGKSERAMKGVTENLEKMANHQETHTRVLMVITRQHGLNDESDDLMTGRK